MTEIDWSEIERETDNGQEILFRPIEIYRMESGFAIMNDPPLTPVSSDNRAMCRYGIGYTVNSDYYKTEEGKQRVAAARKELKREIDELDRAVHGQLINRDKPKKRQKRKARNRKRRQTKQRRK